MKQGVHITQRMWFLYLMCLFTIGLSELSFQITYVVLNDSVIHNLYNLLFALFVVGIVKNISFVLFLKWVRKEIFVMQDLKWILRRFFVLVGANLLLEIMNMGIHLVLLYIGGILPILYVISSVVLAGFTLVASLLVAFVVYDGVKKVSHVLQYVFYLLWQKKAMIFSYALPYFIWLLLYQIASAWISARVVMDFEEVVSLAALWGKGNAFWILTACSVGNLLISALLCSMLYKKVAILYEETLEQDAYFSFSKNIDVMDIDIIDDQKGQVSKDD